MNIIIFNKKKGRKNLVYISKSWKSNGKTYTDSTQMIISLDNIFSIKILNDYVLHIIVILIKVHLFIE